MFDLKSVATLFTAYTVILIHGTGHGVRMYAGDIDLSWADKIVKTVIPLYAYQVEIIVEDE